MELLFADPYYDTAAWGPGRFCSEVAGEFHEVDANAEVLDVDIGRGADWPAVLVRLFEGLDLRSFLVPATAGAIFFSGKRINENIEAWSAIFKKVKVAVGRRKPTRIDETVAVLEAIADIAEIGVDVRELEGAVQILVLDPDADKQEGLVARPHALYVITLRTQDRVWFRVARSDGHVLCDEQFSSHRRGFK